MFETTRPEHYCPCAWAFCICNFYFLKGRKKKRRNYTKLKIYVIGLILSRDSKNLIINNITSCIYGLRTNPPKGRIFTAFSPGLFACVALDSSGQMIARYYCRRLFVSILAY